MTGDKPVLALFDGATHACLATVPQAETLSYADADLVILGMGKREKTEHGHTFATGWLGAFNRGTMKKIWSAPFVKQSWPYRDAVRCGAHIICEDGPDLMVIEAKTGESRRSPAVKPEGAMDPSGLRNEGGALTYITTNMNMRDFNQSAHTFYKLSVPDLKVLETRVVKVIEAASTEKVGDLLITGALYRTACFRSDGTKIWERFQMHRTRAIDGTIYFSDYLEGTARMGSVDVATGKERIFITEKVKKE